MTVVGFATRDWAPAFPDERGHPTLGGSGWYRSGLPARALRERGHEVYLGRLVGRNGESRLGVATWDGKEAFPPVIVLQRWMNEDLDRWIGAARESGQVVIQDVDDWWEGLDPANRAFDSSMADPHENRTHYRRSLAASDLIVCSTPFLAERYSRLAPTTLVRNAIDVDRWSPREPRDGLPTLGWVGSIPWRSKGDVEALSGFLGPFCRRHGLRVIHSGHLEGATDSSGALLPTFEEAARLDGVEVEVRPMRPTTEIPRLWDGVDVALVPLADKPFNRAKSAIGGMSAAAAGVPFVASSTPEYEWLRRENGIGRTASRPADWVRHLTQLMDPAVRREEAERQRARAATYLGIDGLGRDWSRVLASVLADRSVVK